jgi:hypothetical protein
MAIPMPEEICRLMAIRGKHKTTNCPVCNTAKDKAMHVPHASQAYMMQVRTGRTAIGCPGEILHRLLVNFNLKARGGAMAIPMPEEIRVCRLMAIRGKHKTTNCAVCNIATDKATTGMGRKTTNGTAHSPIGLKYLRFRLKEAQGVGAEDAHAAGALAGISSSGDSRAEYY